MKAGGRRDVYLGARECQAYVEPCTFGEEEGFYDNYGEIHLGTMVHGINYPDETGKDFMEARLWRPVMKDGYIEFIRPEECELIRQLREMKPKQFDKNSIQSVDDLYEELNRKG